MDDPQSIVDGLISKGREDYPAEVMRAALIRMDYDDDVNDNSNYLYRIWAATEGYTLTPEDSETLFNLVRAAMDYNIQPQQVVSLRGIDFEIYEPLPWEGEYEYFFIDLRRPVHSREEASKEYQPAGVFVVPAMRSFQTMNDDYSETWNGTGVVVAEYDGYVLPGFMPSIFYVPVAEAGQANLDWRSRH
ncbi:hypothetical protein AB0L65_37970 [Nonomuraea sp. NPDC052116]|uniref:hypothetical protein n=1 Tax=Nonomuraea sp. NPDC052116 TaxID=3155665 RepID=UPI0034178DFB